MRKIVLVFMVAFSFFLTGCGSKEIELTKDEVKFKEEYENLNGKKRGDKEMMSITISDQNKMKYANSSAVVEIFEKKKSGVIYFGFPECPWCRNAVPVLIDAAHDTDLDKIYYANILEERDTKHLDDDGNVVTDTEGSENYYKIVDFLGEKLDVYQGLEDDSIKRLYFPTVVFVRNGKVEELHSGTVESQEDPYKALSDKQKDELKNIYTKAITKVQNLTCDTDKTC